MIESYAGPNIGSASNKALLKEYEAIFKSSTVDFGRLLTLGKMLKYEGFVQESEACFRCCVDLVLHLAANAQDSSCLAFELLVYNNFVKTTETEEHYFRCFEKWTRQVQALGRKQFRTLADTRDPKKLCFVLIDGYLLGHTEVMLKTIDIWRSTGIDAEIYVAARMFDPSFAALLESRQIKMLVPSFVRGHKRSDDKYFLELRDQLESQQIHTAVWVSLPALASYALALRLAPRQVFWSLKFHPLRIPEVDAYLCGGHEVEISRDYNGQQWTVAPFPLTVGVRQNNPHDIESFRKRFPEGTVLLGSLAREDKLTSQVFLATLCSILIRNPHVHYVWTGRTQPPQVLLAFKSSGVLDRCHFIGWVDTNLVAEAIDIFLETFPFGCAVTGFQAMAHGTALLSMQSIDTLYGYQLLGEVRMRLKDAAAMRSDLEALDILTAVDEQHYIELAQRLIDDEEFRFEIGQRELAYFRREEAALPRYAKRLWSNMTGAPS